MKNDSSKDALGLTKALHKVTQLAQEVESRSKGHERFITLCLAAFTIVGCLWIFVISDFLVEGIGVKAKDYAAEEVQNRERALQLENDGNLSKLVDENADQYVNDAVEEEEEEDTTVVEEPLLQVEEEEPVGEEF